MSHGIVSSWDEANGIIVLASALGSFTADDLYEEWKEEMTVSATLSGALPAFRTIGGDPIGGGIEVGAYFFLQNDFWRIRPAEEDATITVSGNLYGEDATKPLFIETVGNFTVILQIDRSPLTQVVSTGVSGLTAQESLDLGNLRKRLFNRVDTNPTTGVITVYDDDNSVLWTGNIFEDIPGLQQYRGRGIERQDKLTGGP